ncbi:MAG: dihydrolipoamide acetyltransferase family protein, partial [Vicinamibacterales bacterium]
TVDCRPWTLSRLVPRETEAAEGREDVMATPVVMPQMGESIAEGTIVRWIKKVGDSVDRDEPLFEISTDKVDAEIPSPAAGTLIEIAVKEGETVPVNSVVATIGAAGEKGVAVAPPATEAPAPSGQTAMHTSQADGSAATSVTSPPAAPVRPQSGTASDPSESSAAPRTNGREAAPAPDGRQKSSPLVRRIAKEHNVDLGRIEGTGIAGRVTKNDILSYLDRGGVPPLMAQAPAGSGGPTAPAVPRPPGELAPPDVVPMSVMRKRIAEHMILSRRTSAHVYSVFEINYSKVDEIRKARRADYEERGVKLTFTSFIAKVAIDCLRRHKVINASIDGDNILYKREINLGIAVALENGLIVPVIKRADELNVLGLSRAIADVADRARTKRLSPDEVHGGTFTITNPGNFGAQFGLPIINQPQVAILGVGTIEKRPVVIDDLIGIRLMGYLTLGYDHRLVDGAVADQFMADVKKGIEAFDGAQI